VAAVAGGVPHTRAKIVTPPAASATLRTALLVRRIIQIAAIVAVKDEPSAAKFCHPEGRSEAEIHTGLRPWNAFYHAPPHPLLRRGHAGRGRATIFRLRHEEPGPGLRGLGRSKASGGEGLAKTSD